MEVDTVDDLACDDLRAGFSWGKRASSDDDNFSCMILFGFDAVFAGRAVDGGVETLDSVLDTLRDEVDFVFPPMICCEDLIRFLHSCESDGPLLPCPDPVSR